MDDSIDMGHSVLASCHLLMRQFDKALAEAERAVAINPNGAYAYRVLAQVVGSTGKWDESVLNSEQAIRLNPFPEVIDYWFLGRAYFRRGGDESIAALKKALRDR